MELKERLGELAQQQGVTLLMTLLSGWAVLLGRWSGQEDMIIGTRTAGRRRPETEPPTGRLENTIIVRVLLQENPTVEQLLKQVTATVAQACARQDVTHEQVIETLKKPDGHRPVLQVLMELAETPAAIVGSAELESSELKISELSIEPSKTELELCLSLREGREGLTGTLEYASDLFDRGTIERMVASWQVLLEGMTTGSRQRISQLPILTEAERALLLRKFNDTAIAYPQDRLTHELFQEQVERTPEAVAVVYEGQSLTYAELNDNANRLAWHLRGEEIGIGDYIPILMSRSLQMLIAQLAVLKCGGVYVPIDPELPVERREFMIRDCGARWILTDAGRPADLQIESVHWVDCSRAGQAANEVGNLELQMDSATPAYVMYTSGSTGAPKGAVVPHRAINRLVINNGFARIEPEDCIAHYSNPAFDASTFEIWGALLNGARVVIVPQSIVLEAARFGEVLEQQRVSVLWMTVGLFHQYTETLPHVFRELRYLIVGGDTLEPGAARRVLRDSPPRHLLNAYGPTECTTFTTTYLIEALEEGMTSIPIGRPISNAQVYILDALLQPVPIGTSGEIYVGGAGVACGYLRRPELTAERFLPNPFDATAQARMYRTGDLGRWRTDGAIEFLGRNDHQVKIRGFRVELGEIEAQLARHEQIKEAVVIAREDVPGEKRLVAYVVPRDPSSAASVEELRAHLKAILPQYMAPSAFVTLGRMPLTPNGKPDRRALPAPGLEAYGSHEYECPLGKIEAVLEGIWRQMLGVERVGRKDQFFELGGDSVTVLKLCVSVAETFAIQFDTRTVLRNPIFQDMAHSIEALLPPGRSSVTTSQTEFEEGVV
jgi:amino acid adenylation domain-containing protein